MAEITRYRAIILHIFKPRHGIGPFGISFYRCFTTGDLIKVEAIYDCHLKYTVISFIPWSICLANSLPIFSAEFPDLWGLTANEVANRNSSACLSLQEYHIDQDIDVKSEVRPIESVAFYPLHLLLKNLTPFNYGIENDSSTPKAFIPVFSNSIKLYQLYIFFIYAINELGSEYAEKILEVQSKHLETWLDSHQAYALTARFDDISQTSNEHCKQYRSGLDYISLDIPVEQSIAKLFLLQNKESPLYVENNDSREPNEINFRGMDLALADHLGLAKDTALEVYSRYFNIVIVEV